MSYASSLLTHISSEACLIIMISRVYLAMVSEYYSICKSETIKEFITIVILSMDQAFNNAQVFQAIQDQLDS